MNSRLKHVIERHAFVIFTLALLGAWLPAEAAIIKEFNFTGRVTAIPSHEGTLLPGVAINDTITGTFSYDIDTLPSYTSPSLDFRTYGGALVGFSLKLGQYEASMTNSGFVSISNDFTYPNLGTRDKFSVGTGLGNLTGTGPLPVSYANIDLLAYTGTFHDLTLPDFLALDAFYARSIGLSVALSDGTFPTIFGEMTTLSQVSAVPLPPALYLLSSALLGLGMLQRSGTRKTKGCLVSA